jgi:hypothetical protein
MHGSACFTRVTVYLHARRRVTRQGDRAFAPTCVASCCGRTLPGGERTGSRSARSSNSNPGGSPPGPAASGRPTRRWHRSPGCGPASWYATRPCATVLRPIRARPRTVPQIAPARAARAGSNCNRADLWEAPWPNHLADLERIAIQFSAAWICFISSGPNRLSARAPGFQHETSALGRGACPGIRYVS